VDNHRYVRRELPMLHSFITNIRTRQDNKENASVHGQTADHQFVPTL